MCHSKLQTQTHAHTYSRLMMILFQTKKWTCLPNYVSELLPVAFVVFVDDGRQSQCRRHTVIFAQYDDDDDVYLCSGRVRHSPCDNSHFSVQWILSHAHIEEDGNTQIYVISVCHTRFMSCQSGKLCDVRRSFPVIADDLLYYSWCVFVLMSGVRS